MLTARDLALYQALAAIDGPWWGERESAYARLLCSVTAAAGGVSIPADDFAIEWVYCEAGDQTEAERLTPADGLRMLAKMNRVPVTEVKSDGRPLDR